MGGGGACVGCARPCGRAFEEGGTKSVRGRPTPRSERGKMHAHDPKIRGWMVGRGPLGRSCGRGGGEGRVGDVDVEERGWGKARLRAHPDPFGDEWLGSRTKTELAHLRDPGTSATPSLIILRQRLGCVMLCAPRDRCREEFSENRPGTLPPFFVARAGCSHPTTPPHHDNTKCFALAGRLGTLPLPLPSVPSSCAHSFSPLLPPPPPRPKKTLNRTHHPPSPHKRGASGPPRAQAHTPHKPQP